MRLAEFKNKALTPHTTIIPTSASRKTSSVVPITTPLPDVILTSYADRACTNLLEVN